jgi:hypothetical protein
VWVTTGMEIRENPGIVEERKDVDLGGYTVKISNRYLLEAYEKTLKEDLHRIQENLKCLTSP